VCARPCAGCIVTQLPHRAYLLSVPEVTLSSGDRVLFPEDGITKGDLFEYYGEIAPAILPHLRDRPFTFKRYPHGIDADVYFQKQIPRGAPAWLKTREFTTHPRGGGSRQVDFALVDSRAALQWTVQMNCIDMNVWYSRVDKPHRPDYVVFDLDPPDEPDGFAQAIEVAHRIRELLDELELPGYVKTSGADGIHVLAPITRRSTFQETYDFAEAASRLLEERHPGLVTTQWLKKKRVGVLLDHRQNGAGKTIASAYSVRPKPGAPVSTPLRWEELTADVRPQQFTMEVALQRVAEHGDLFAAVLDDPRPLAHARRKLEACT
jgi:bifunctional non-homologous end joining protein LigD